MDSQTDGRMDGVALSPVPGPTAPAGDQRDALGKARAQEQAQRGNTINWWVLLWRGGGGSPLRTKKPCREYFLWISCEYVVNTLRLFVAIILRTFLRTYCKLLFCSHLACKWALPRTFYCEHDACNCRDHVVNITCEHVANITANMLQTFVRI